MNQKTGKIAIGGILAALTVIVVIAASFVPTGKASLYVLASFLTAIFIIHTDLKYGILFYIVSSLLIWIILPEKIAVIPYVGFFGWYAIVKALIEKLNKRFLEWLIKILLFNALAVTSFFLFQSLLPKIDYSNPIVLLTTVAPLEVIFVIYDYVFTLIIDFYYKRFYNKIKL